MKLLLILVLGFFPAGAFAASAVDVDRGTNVFNTPVLVSSAPMAGVRVGVFGAKPVVVLNAPGYAPVLLRNVSGSTASTTPITVSTSATSSQGLTIGGAVAALPVTGYPKNTVMVLTTDNALYLSTETVAGAFSWVKVGAQ